ncbi:hypothetical protein EVAR_39005_1 [Eumeta japonica]|uniref:DUF4371 domain-containing protein n=1 Tax=Eumeta variegata TaxID=151549 RepID=A0A4C1WQN6_EUMVA|nr:hypothetical protein EVAR_39005_1 [Eumeta japonica]
MMIDEVDLVATIKNKKKNKKENKKVHCVTEIIDSEKPCRSRFLPNDVTLAIESTCASSSNSEASSPVKIPFAPPTKKEKDKTLVSIQQEGKFYRKRVTEDHYVILSEPGSDYFEHVTCELSTAKGIESTILTYLKSKSVALSEIYVVGCDGTVVNTGSKGGVIRMMEEELKKPSVSYIRMNYHCDTCYCVWMKKTTGPKCFAGPIGSQLQKCETMPIVEFTAISSTLPETTANDLSSDQKYLYDIMVAVSTSVFSSGLANIKPRPLNHFRWLTTANRILRLYVSKTDPEEKLVILATYVMKVYAPMWFTIKSNPSCINGAKHLWQTISLSRYLNPDLKKIVDNVIQQNGYFGHPENVLIDMLGDDMESISTNHESKIRECTRTSKI